MRVLFALGVATALLAVTPPVHGQPTVYESFSYPTGNLNGQNGGVGFNPATPWDVLPGVATVQAGSLTPPAPASGLPTAGNSVTFTQSSPTLGAVISRDFAVPVVGTPGNSVWVSAVMKGTGEFGNVGQGSISFNNGGPLGFSITTGATGGGPPPALPTNTWSLGDASSGFFEASSTVSSTAQSLLVARATFGASSDTVDLFINPVPGATPPTTPDVTLDVPHADSLTTVQLVYASLASGNSMFVDEIRLGDSFGAVTGVPEPSTLLLAGAAGLGGVLLRRRKSRPEVG